MSIKTRFCPHCGKEVKTLADGLCADCFVEKTGVQLPKAASIKECKKCGMVNFTGMWVKTEFPAEHHLEQILVSKLKLPEDALLESLKVEDVKSGLVKITYSVGGKKFTREANANIEIKKMVCPNCSHQAEKSYMGILQVRGQKDVHKLVDNVLDFSEKYKSNIIKAEEVNAGVDIEISSKDAARHLASELRKNFNLKMKTSHEQYSWDKTKCRPKSRIHILLMQR